MNPQINIKSEIDLPGKLPVIDGLDQLFESVKQNNQRIIINFQGSRAWCLSRMNEHSVDGDRIVFSNQADCLTGLPFSKAYTMLGQETDCVVYDGFSGLNIDVFCMAAGMLKAGGVLLLLTAENPEDITDVYGEWQGKENHNQYFLKYFLQHLALDMYVYQQQSPTPVSKFDRLPYSPMVAFNNNLTVEQADLLKKLQLWLKQKSKPLFLLTADRGRGKSTALGWFARQQDVNINIVVTAASKAQVSLLFKQLGNEFHHIQFLAPDEIIRRNKRIELLLIDEAAMLPNSILQQCLLLSDKTLLSTTTGGYEGTGQGFLIKFMAGFKGSDYIHHELEQAVRWGQKDLLEQWINNVLLFNATKNTGLLNPQEVARPAIDIQIVSKKQLSEDEKTLREIYALLVSAHYRTRPADLRQLMDDENQRILITRSAQGIIAVLLLNEEGGFNAELCFDVFMGKRRPQGHLFAQMITAQAGVKNFASFKGFRIQRIAVLEAYRKMGFGRLLINAAEKIVAQKNYDYLASSFALDDAVAPFWKSLDFNLIHIGSGKGKSSGRQAVAVIKTFNPQVIEIVTALNQKVKNYLPTWLLTYCQTMNWLDVLSLLEILNFSYQFSALDDDELMAFCGGYRGFDLTQAVLQKLIISQLGKNQLPELSTRLCIEKILLNKAWDELSGFYGKKEALKQLRLSVFQLNNNRQTTAHEQNS